MKTIVLYIFILLTFFVSCKKEKNSSSSNPGTSLNMGAGNTNDIYFSLTKGVVKSEPGTNWDIAFNTWMFSATIITNGGAGIKLYTYPDGDTSSWNKTLSTTSINTRPAMYNADTSWTWGAFQRNKTANPFDYGWGVYNLNTNEVVGDSLFIIQLQDNTYRKLWIIKRSVNSTFIFQYANLDGTGQKLDSVNCNNYSAKNFIYYSIARENTIDREPADTAWDFVATRYIATTGEPSPKVVTGILTSWIFNFNPAVNSYTTTGTVAAEITGVNDSTTNYSSAHFSTQINTIGWDWTTYNQATNTYSILPQQVYFLKTSSDNIYKLVFTGLTAGTGIIQFDQTRIK